MSPYLCRAERDQFTPVYFGPCYKPWFQMYKKTPKTSCYFNSSMLLWYHLRMWVNPLRTWGLHQGDSAEVHYKGVTVATAWDTESLPRLQQQHD